ncbi:glutamine-hydrolyzing carbamoyl-phosphate synthase small subunit [Hydrogenivirga sp. 128-5-R1-1]|uniref:glutamine-hydrolyzing carbamoyl-phosphate synthase small subunit n=1 Tax=Hydrogenivirga sp. 128-5-R1-1 TaxID=392423 RepID=UPI00015EF859|nr:glutamine-hydrolyzing carbamoyl-phosphate synthase small subunit [Hydrogenivirga sp. 128-5-R1-1]EDP75626.1 carbamoyl-phosphate synthase small subunit [Hydrogenivirga sp. 128-5-R1-1]
MKKRAILALEDGTYFLGYSFGAEGETQGELIFNTSMTGYQEILTDPSYRGQIVVMTYTQMGNYGINAEDIESRDIQVNGFVVKEAFTGYSNWRAKGSLGEYLKERGVVAIEGIDTRALVKRIRERGVIRGVISTVELDPKKAVEKARKVPDISELDLVKEVSTREPYTWSQGDWKLTEGYTDVYNERPLIAVVDFGVKFNILRRLTNEGAKVVVVPPEGAMDFVKREDPNALFLSNGPGDPERVVEGIRLVREFAGKKPIFGICLGCQIIGLALGGKTYKLKFGHHGGNHPVKDLRTGKVEITAQNHNFAIDPDSLPPEVEVTHVNLLDNTVEGIRHREIPVFAVQYHPENSPGPHDSYYLFKEFVEIAKRASL